MKSADCLMITKEDNFTALVVESAGKKLAHVFSLLPVSLSNVLCIHCFSHLINFKMLVQCN